MPALGTAAENRQHLEGGHQVQEGEQSAKGVQWSLCYTRGSPLELMGSFASAGSATSTASAASFLWESPWLKVIPLSQVSPHPLPHLSTTL